jgi:hypothetical protein
MIEGSIVPVISVAPESIVLGSIPQGGAISKKVLVRGKKPFRITDVSCEDGCFSFATPDETSQRHVVELTFTADCDPGDVRRQIHFATDLGEEYRTTCMVHATVLPGEPTVGEDGATTAASSSVRLATGR